MSKATKNQLALSHKHTCRTSQRSPALVEKNTLPTLKSFHGDVVKKGSRITIKVLLYQVETPSGKNSGTLSEESAQFAQTINGTCAKRTNRGTNSYLKIKHIVNNVPVIQSFPLYSPFLMEIKSGPAHKKKKKVPTIWHG